MNQEKIGKFIASCRKDAGITQAALAEELGITDRAVSKWENGKSLPDASNMIELCKVLNITINELLSGEHIAMENYKEKAEENFAELKTKVDNTVKALNTISLICVIVSVTMFLFTIIYQMCVNLSVRWICSLPLNMTVLQVVLWCIVGITVLNAFVCTMLKYEVTK